MENNNGDRVCRVIVSTELFLEALNFPEGTIVRACNGEKAYEGSISLILEHPDLPPVEESNVIPTAIPTFIYYTARLNKFKSWNLPKPK